MSSSNDDPRDADVPEQAVKALTAAHRRALKAGRTLVVVKDGKLVRVTGTRSTVLGEGFRRTKVHVKVKSTTEMKWSLPGSNR